MMKTFTQLLLILATITFADALYAQSTLSSSTANKVDIRTKETPIFVHIVDQPAATNAKLQAQNSGTAADFTWYKFDMGTLSFEATAFKTESSVTQSEADNLGAGGYKVEISTGGTVDTTMYAWVLMDEKIKISAITPTNRCEVLSLLVSHNAQIYRVYYDLSKTPAEQISLYSNPKITWKTVPEDIFDGVFDDERKNSWKTPAGTVSSVTARTEIRDPAPLVSAVYTAVIKNDFGNESEPVSTAQIPAVAVYAAMKAEEQEASGSWVATTTLTGSALYKLRFDHSGSKNADTYTWVAYDNDDYIQTKGRVLWTHTASSATDMAYVKYEYMGEELDGYIPGKYRDSLFVLNSVTGCKDSIDLQFILGEGSPFITVEPSKFDAQSMPNVFTPNGDGINDVFKFVTGNEPVSMKIINLRIFDRAGKELYKYIGRVSDWQGWNGKINGTGADCTVGVYYYDISGTGWDNVPYTGKPYRGFVHLFKE